MSALVTSYTIWIGLPAYNEEATIPALFPRFERLFSDPQANYRILLYNDGSSDRTVERASQWHDRLKLQVIGKERNLGLGEGLRSLIAHVATHGSGNDVCFIMDCDDTHRPEQIEGMLEKLAQGCEVVIASRYRKGSRVAGVSSQRQILSLGAAALFKLLHHCSGVRDYTCGFRGYRVAVLQRARAHYGQRLIEEQGFACMVELLLKLNRIGARMCEVPIDLRYDRKAGASKMDVSANTMRLLRKLWAWRIHGLD